jgi:hypothetical protein
LVGGVCSTVVVSGVVDEAIAVVVRAGVGALDGEADGDSVIGAVVEMVVGDVVGDLVVGDGVGGVVVGDSVGGVVVVRAVGAIDGDAVGAPVGDVVGDIVGDEVGDIVGDEVGDAVGDAVGVVIGDKVGDAVGDATGGTVGEAVPTTTATPQSPSRHVMRGLAAASSSTDGANGYCTVPVCCASARMAAHPAFAEQTIDCARQLTAAHTLMLSVGAVVGDNVDVVAASVGANVVAVVVGVVALTTLVPQLASRHVTRGLATASRAADGAKGYTMVLVPCASAIIVAHSASAEHATDSARQLTAAHVLRSAGGVGGAVATVGALDGGDVADDTPQWAETHTPRS